MVSLDRRVRGAENMVSPLSGFHKNPTVVRGGKSNQYIIPFAPYSPKYL